MPERANYGDIAAQREHKWERRAAVTTLTTSDGWLSMKVKNISGVIIFSWSHLYTSERSAGELDDRYPIDIND